MAWGLYPSKPKLKHAAGTRPRAQPVNVRRPVEELTTRLAQRKRELQAMTEVGASTPFVIGGILTVAQRILARRKGEAALCVDAQPRSLY